MNFLISSFNFTVVKQLKGTSYNHVKTTVFGSRDQLCISPELESKSSSVKDHMCQKKNTKLTKCEFNDMSKLRDEKFKEARVIDIEDLVQIGKIVRCCPYYASKQLASDADVIFMPYNYLLDQNILKYLNLNLNDAIIIFDEAHNVLNTSQDAASAQITTDEITKGVNEIEQVSKNLEY